MRSSRASFFRICSRTSSSRQSISSSAVPLSAVRAALSFGAIPLFSVLDAFQLEGQGYHPCEGHGWCSHQELNRRTGSALRWHDDERVMEVDMPGRAAKLLVQFASLRLALPKRG
jgi:hypothetical protein